MSVTWKHVRLDEVAPSPWRNGGGVTRELLAWPTPNDWTVRLSVADVVSDGPFSRFPGIRRWFAVLSGAGVRLRVDGEAHELTVQQAPYRLDGAADAQCELLRGPTQDFNLMLRQGDARMQRVSGSCGADVKSRTLLAVYAHGIEAILACGDERLRIAPGTLAWRILDSGGPVQLTAQDALWMEIEP